jgi:hypothetical protein
LRRPASSSWPRQCPPSILTVGKLVIDFTVNGEAAGQQLVAELLKQGL